MTSCAQSSVRLFRSSSWNFKALTVSKVISDTGTEYFNCNYLYRYRGVMKFLNVAQDEVFGNSISTAKGESDRILEKVE